jgi:hypothetical protein
VKPDPVTPDAWRARRAILHLAATGTPPDDGVEAFTVGLEPILGVLGEEYMAFLGDGLSAFKLVVGAYGGGKTHFLLSVRELAFRYGAAVAYVTLNPQESPFDKLEMVYRRVAEALQSPPATAGERPERGLEAFVRRWAQARLGDPEDQPRRPGMARLTEELTAELAGIESTAYRNALVGACTALARHDEETFSALVQYLKGEGAEKEFLRTHRVFEPLDRSNAFRAIRSLARFVRLAGHPGLVLLFDEAERMVSLSGSRNQRAAVDNLRQFIDECGGSLLEGVLLFYAVPREDLLFGSGSGAVYEALRQRLSGTFRDVNPTGVKIDLEQMGLPPTRFLEALAGRLAALYDRAFDDAPDPELVADALPRFTRAAWEQRFGDEGYRRLFVKAFLQGLNRLRRAPGRPLTDAEVEAIVSGQGAAAPDLEDLG